LLYETREEISMAKTKEETAAMESTTPDIHLPPPSFWPIVLAAGMTLMAIGIIFTVIVAAVGLVVMMAAIIGWTAENREITRHEEHHHE
jgi:cytochrome c oxidase subunit 1